MRKLEIKRYNPSIINNATLIRDGKSFMRTYNLNNGYIYKEVKYDEKSLSSSLYLDDFVDCLTKKLKLSTELSDKFLILPKTVYMNHDKVTGYTVPVYNMPSFDQVVENSNDLDFITDSFVLLCQAVKEMNKEGVLFPDLANASNIFYDPKTKKIRFIDFDGLQVGDCDSFSIAKLMCHKGNDVFTQEKYFDKVTCLFTTNFDKASLLALYLYFTTGTKLVEFNHNDFKVDKRNHEISLKKEPLDYYIKSIGLTGSPLEEDINLVYDNNSNNKYLETSIKRLRKTHRLDTHELRFEKIA